MSTRESFDEEDFFQDTRMSFGDHIEVLRIHLWRAIIGLGVCLVIGFILDAIGDAVGVPQIGIGRPLLNIIQDPVRKALFEFNERRIKDFDEKAKTPGTKEFEASQFKDMRARIGQETRAKVLGKPVEEVPEGEIDVTIRLSPVEINGVAYGVESIVRPRELVVMSAQEGFIIYFKVSLIAGLVLASPWVFYQIWSVIAAGLFPSEKRYVHVYLPFSVGLFIVGVVMCQFMVMPRTVGALLWFNEYIGVTPDLRLSEWLSLAILFPLLFGISFQTPLVMLFLERIGAMTVESFRKRRKVAIFGLAVFAAIATPSPDPTSMCLLWIPMCLLYELGIWLCVFSPNKPRDVEGLDVPESDDLIEV